MQSLGQVSRRRKSSPRRGCAGMVCLAALLLAGSPQAPALDFAGARTLLTYRSFNMAANVVVLGGHALITDTDRDRLAIVPLDGRAIRWVRVSSRAQYVEPLSPTRVAVTDAYDNRLEVVDVNQGRVVWAHTFRRSFGALQTLFAGGILYGANQGDGAILRYDVRRRRELKPWDAGGGSADQMTLHRGQLVVVNRSAPGTGRGATWFDVQAGRRAGGAVLGRGSLRDVASFDGRLCLAVSGVDQVLCGQPGDRQLAKVASVPAPYRLIATATTLWVLGRGPSPSLAAMSTTGTVASWTIPPATVANPRAIAVTDDLVLLRGNERLVAIPR